MKSDRISPKREAFVEASGKLHAIKLTISEFEGLRKGSHAKLNMALTQIYQLTQTLRDQKHLRPFVEHKQYRWSKKSEENPFYPMVALGFDDVPAASVSKYATVLLHADKEGVSGEQFSEWYNAKPQEELLRDARGKGVPDQDEYAETELERLHRGLDHLQGLGLGKPVAISPDAIPSVEDPELPGINQYRRALVRIEKGKANIVEFLKSSPAELRAEISALASPEGSSSARKLQGKPLYDLFKACDLAVRLLGSKDDAIYDDEGFFALEIGFSQEEWEASVQARTKKKVLNRQPFILRRGLRLSFVGEHWIAERISNELTFACIVMQLNCDLPLLKKDVEYFLDEGQVRHIAALFRASGDWTVRPRTAGDINKVADDRELALRQFVPELWRHRALGINAQSIFAEVERHRLSALLGWQKEYKATYHTSLPKLLEFGVHGTQVVVMDELAEADDLVGAKPLIHNKDVGPDLIAGLKDRRIRRNDLLALAELARSYEETVELGFGHGNEGVVSLELRLGKAQLTLPLAVSLTGDYAEVAEPIL